MLYNQLIILSFRLQYAEMSYSSIKPGDNGLLQYGSNSYGGFSYIFESFDDATIVEDPTKRFITEHNLSLFWRRPGLCPRSGGFLPFPISWPLNLNGIHNRPPGNIRADCPPIRHRGRNLLAGQIIQDDEEAICIWSINDNSDHRQLLQFNLKLEQQLPQRKKPLHVAPNEECPSISMDLPNDVLQLRTFEGTEGKVFLRTKRSLELACPSENSLTTIFKTFIHSFTQIPYMDEELAVVDSRGVLFWGSIGNTSSTSFDRFKNPEPIIEICPTDCPRILMSITEKQLKEVDLREPISCTGRLLFDHSINSQLQIDGPFSKNLREHLATRDNLWHINQISTNLECFLLTTTRQHLLIDRRMPGICLLSMDHAEMEGSDYCFTTPPFVDPVSDCQIFSFYSLTQIKKPAISQWSICFHSKESLWSSLSPKFVLDSPKDVFIRFVNTEPQNNFIDVNKLPTITRAIHYQPLHSNLTISSTRALLFRQMEGGEIWYENVFFDPFPRLKQDEKMDINYEENTEENSSQKPISISSINKNCIKFISNWQKHQQLNLPFFKNIDDRLLANVKFEELNASIVPINEEEQILNLTEQILIKEDFNPFNEINQISNCSNELMEENFFSDSIEEKNLVRKFFIFFKCFLKFSLIINNIWNKTKEEINQQHKQKIFENSLERTINLTNEIDQEIDNLAIEELKIKNKRKRKEINFEEENNEEMRIKRIIKDEEEEQLLLMKSLIKEGDEEEDDEYNFDVNID